jgi:signal transduction histidine kinase
MDKLLREYTASVTHALRAPLVALKGYAEILLESHAAGLSPRGRDLLTGLHQNAVLMAKLLSGLHAYAQLGEEHGGRTRVELGAVLQGLLEGRRDEIRARGARVEIAPDLPPVEGHPTQLQTLLDALLDNTLKHHPGPDGPRVRLGLSRAEPPVFFLEDDGPGVPEELRERVFELFVRGPTRLPGAGLGLSLARRVVELHQGRIWLEHGELGGARVCFELGIE